MPNKIGNSAFINTTMKANEIHAKKKFGQNFLKDERILNEIVDVSECDKDTLVIEVGPGLGSLTEVLCKKAGFVLAYEIDNELIPILRENLKYYDNFDIINQDILEADINSDINKYKKSFKNVYLVRKIRPYRPLLQGHSRQGPGALSPDDRSRHSAADRTRCPPALHLRYNRCHRHQEGLASLAQTP